MGWYVQWSGVFRSNLAECQTHFPYNVLDACPKKLQPEMMAALKSLYEADDYATAALIRGSMVSGFVQDAPRAVNVLEGRFDDTLVVLNLPLPVHRRLRTTKGIESYMSKSGAGNGSSASYQMRNCFADIGVLLWRTTTVANQ